MLQSTTALCNVSEKMRPYKCVTFICSLERSTIYISYTNMVGIRDTNFLFAKTLTLSGICFVLSTIHRSIMNSFNFKCVHLLAALFFSWGLKKKQHFYKTFFKTNRKIKLFSVVSRYVDDVLSLNNIHFNNCLSFIQHIMNLTLRIVPLIEGLLIS